MIDYGDEEVTAAADETEWYHATETLDADTGKPLDPSIGRKTYITYNDIKKDKSGVKSIVAHRSPSGNVVAVADGE